MSELQDEEVGMVDGDQQQQQELQQKQQQQLASNKKEMIFLTFRVIAELAALCYTIVQVYRLI